MSLPKMLLAEEASELLRVAVPRLYDLAKRGMIPCARLGRQVRFPEDALVEWIRAGGSPLGPSNREEALALSTSKSAPASHNRRWNR